MHTIRLRRPWQKRIGDRTRRVDVPDLEPTKLGAGEVVGYQRTFHLPTNLEPGQAVMLAIGGWQGRLERLCLNGHELDVDQAPIHFDVSEWLQPTNRLEVDLAADANLDARLSGEVALNIGEVEVSDG